MSLIDDLSANMSYNMAAKERPWSDLSINLRLKLTKSYTFNIMRHLLRMLILLIKAVM